MAARAWNWKNKDGTAPGLLYEAGNWGDILKLLWLEAVLAWKRRAMPRVNYFDPFAGDVQYPLGEKTSHRLTLSRLDDLHFIQAPFLDRHVWPSAASGAALVAGGAVEVWDADPGRRARWAEVPGVSVPQGECGWRLLADRPTDPAGVWLVDPYDILAEWRERLKPVVAASHRTTTLVYIYNRSGKSPAHFRDYRAFRTAVAECRAGLPLRLGRVAADAFLPASHHEMLFLPSQDDCARHDLHDLFQTLLDRTEALTAGVVRCSVFDC